MLQKVKLMLHLSPAPLPLPPAGSMLQKIKLMLHLEIIALQRNLANLEQQQQAEAADEMLMLAAVIPPAGGPAAAAAASVAVAPGVKLQAGALQALRGAAARGGGIGGVDGAGVGGDITCIGGGGGSIGGALPSPGLSRPVSEERALWSRRLEQVQVLLVSVTTLHATLAGLCERAEVSSLAGWTPLRECMVAQTGHSE